MNYFGHEEVELWHMRGPYTYIHLNRKLKYTEKAVVVARYICSWLLHHNQYVRQYYSECYNRDIQVEN